MKKIGQGMWGVVYMGCINKLCKYKYASKKSKYDLSLEYRLGMAAYKASPNGVVRPFGLSNGVLYMEYIPEIDITKKNFKTVTKQVIKILLRIQKKYPSFRHNDLSFNNVFVNPERKVFIGDFGLANIEQSGLRNPNIKFFKKTYGIYPNSHSMFDLHFFLNSLFVNGHSELKPVIGKLLPKEYLGINTSKLINGRLRPDISHSTLPTMTQIFSTLLLT